MLNTEEDQAEQTEYQLMELLDDLLAPLGFVIKPGRQLYHPDADVLVQWDGELVRAVWGGASSMTIGVEDHSGPAQMAQVAAALVHTLVCELTGEAGPC